MSAIAEMTLCQTLDNIVKMAASDNHIQSPWERQWIQSEVTRYDEHFTKKQKRTLRENGYVV